VLHAVSKKDQHCFERRLNGSVARQVRGVTAIATAMQVASNDNQNSELNCTFECHITSGRGGGKN
jgi:hypothetical protein